MDCTLRNMSNLDRTGFKNKGIDYFLSHVSTDKTDLRPSKLGRWFWFFVILWVSSSSVVSVRQALPKNTRRREGVSSIISASCLEQRNLSRRDPAELLEGIRPGSVNPSLLRWSSLLGVGYPSGYLLKVMWQFKFIVSLVHKYNFFVSIEWPSWFSMSSASHHPHRLGLKRREQLPDEEGQRDKHTWLLSQKGPLLSFPLLIAAIMPRARAWHPEAGNNASSWEKTTHILTTA